MIIPAKIMELGPTIGSSAVHVYAVLDQHADEDGVCWPSVRTIAEIAGMSERNVRRHLRTLEQHDQIVTEERKTDFGRTSNLYRLLTTHKPPDKSDTTPGQKRQGAPDKSARGTIPKEQEPVERESTELEPLNENQGNGKAAPSISVSAVWEHYKTHRPRVRVMGKDVEKKILARIKGGFTADDLCRAIDGNFRSPYHCGQNDTQTEYHALELIVRNDAKVNQFLDVPEAGEKPILTGKSQRTLAACRDFAEEPMNEVE